MTAYNSPDWPSLPPLNALINKVHCADALELLKLLPSESVDLAFADPPYNLGYGYDLHNDKMPEGEYLAWCYLWITELIRVLNPTGSLFILHLPKFAIPIGAFLHSRMTFQHWIAWKAASRSSNKPLMPEHYALLYYTKSEVFSANEVRYRHKRCRNCNELIADYGGKSHLAHKYGPQISDVWTDIGRAKHGQRGEHPCKLPDKLVGRVIEFASNPGDLVLDPFNGTGTTTYMAQRLGRDYIGIELSEKYTAITQKRMAQPYMLNLFTSHNPANVKGMTMQSTLHNE